jgi:hypothetical protein
MSPSNEIFEIRDKSIKLSKMVIMVCPDDRFGVQKNTASCVLSAS